MEDYRVIKYSFSNYVTWNDFVSKSKNATFLFHRDFMEYHQDRFEDFSLLIYKKDKLVALLPANKKGNEIYSHQGLTYGGFVLPNKISFQIVLEAVYEALKFFAERDIEKFIIKQLPKIYYSRPSDEMDYFLFILNSKLVRRDVSMVIPLNQNVTFSKLRNRLIKRAQKAELNFKLERDMTSFWNEILIPNLKTKYGVSPVHSLEEITLLKEKFPNNIKQYNVSLENELLAGCTIFETKNVAHVQYISTKKEENIGALDFLMNQLIFQVYKDKKYFDFGISNENEGRNINEGLLNWKQSFGASTIVHDFYEIEVANYTLLKSVMS